MWKCFLGKEVAQEEEQYFIDTFSKKNVDVTQLPVLEVKEGAFLLSILVENKLAKSKNEARQKIRQGGVSLDNERVNDEQYEFTLDNNQKVFRVGKKHFFVLNMKK